MAEIGMLVHKILKLLSMKSMKALVGALNTDEALVGTGRHP